MLSKLAPQLPRALRAASRAVAAPAVARAVAPVARAIAPRARGLAAQAAAAPKAAAAKPDMFCFQCEQTQNGTGCTVVGVCGKTPETAATQDLLIYGLRGLAQYVVANRAAGIRNRKMDDFVLEAAFSTLTNVNFDSEAIVRYIAQVERHRDEQRALYKGPPLSGPAAYIFPAEKSVKAMEAAGREVASIFDRRQSLGPDIVGLQELIVYGVKGFCAYAHHAAALGKTSETVFDNVYAALAATTVENPTVDFLLGAALKVGAANFEAMSLLDAGHTGSLGHPTPHSVPTKPVPGKSILVSGHDLHDLEALLKATEGTGINVYTHGEMLPAHGYPGLRKYKHLAGQFGGPWQLQKFEFAAFPGAILLTSNCLIEPRRSYRDRIFTSHAVGWPGIPHIKDAPKDFSQVIAKAKACPGFTAEDCEEYADNKPLLVGFGHNAILGVADKVIEGVKSGAITRFFVVGGCDGSEGERSYFTDVVQHAPKSSVVLTLGCGKYRLNKLNLGDIGGIPRLLDMGQCNDAFGAVQVALALAKAFNTDVNGLPLSFAISWFEQKAVAVLLTLLHLGVRNIHLGPALPAFATPNMLNILQSKFNLQQIDHQDFKADLAKMLAGK